jgi:hypothetical protein
MNVRLGRIYLSGRPGDRKEINQKGRLFVIIGLRTFSSAIFNALDLKKKTEAERVGKYVIRPLLSLERLSFSEKEGKVCYQDGKQPKEAERMDYPEFIARVTSHIPDKGQVTIRSLSGSSGGYRDRRRILFLIPPCLSRRNPLDFQRF